MRLKTRIALAAIPVAAAVVAGIAIGVRTHMRRRKKREAASFLSDESRIALQKLCDLKGDDFVPDGLGLSMYERTLDSLTDGQLVGVYLLIKVVEVLRARNVDMHQLSKEELAITIREAAHNKQGRKEMLKWLGSFGADAIRSMLSDGLMLASMTEQSA